MSQELSASDLPAYWELILPALRVVANAGGSAKSSEIENGVLALAGPSDEMLSVMQPNRPGVSVYVDRVKWGRSYAKLIGGLESPRRGLFMLTPLGREILAMPEVEAMRRIRHLDREYRRNRGTAKHSPTVSSETEQLDLEGDEPVLGDDGVEPAQLPWREVLWSRLHALSPTAFEELALYVLRAYGMELTRVGGSGDEGIDGIGTAPLTSVLSSRVAVQVKRYDPAGRPVSRDVVALLQRDAAYRGAERAILVTLGRFTDQARKAAIATTPTVDLIDGQRLADLMLEQEIGVRRVPWVDERWFDRFGANP